MRSSVSFHAIIRYVQRVLGEPVSDWLVGTERMNEEARARICCQRAGVPYGAVIDLVLCPPVLAACVAGFKEVIVRYEGFAYVVRTGRVISILTEEMHDRTTGRLSRLRTDNRKSARRDIIKNERRMKGRNRSRNRRMAEVE
jgi:hypothetical protein